MNKLIKATVILHQNCGGLPSLLIQKMEEMQEMGEGQWSVLDNQLPDVLIINGHQIKEWQAVRLSIDGAQKNGLGKVIGAINFPHLKVLSLQSNNIQSVEMLSRVYASNLQDLWLCRNKIIALSSLRKMRLNKISILFFTGNFVLDANLMTEVDWPRLSRIGIQENTENQQQNISFPTKLNNKFCRQYQYLLCIDSPNRINERRLLKSLVRKQCVRSVVDIITKDDRFTKQNQAQ